LVHWLEQHCAGLKHPGVPSGEHGAPHTPFWQLLVQQSLDELQPIPCALQPTAPQTPFTQLPEQHVPQGKPQAIPFARQPSGPHVPKLQSMLQQSVACAHPWPSGWHVAPLDELLEAADELLAPDELDAVELEALPEVLVEDACAPDELLLVAVDDALPLVLAAALPPPTLPDDVGPVVPAPPFELAKRLESTLPHPEVVVTRATMTTLR
jgi:hypothetical protein